MIPKSRYQEYLERKARRENLGAFGNVIATVVGTIIGAVASAGFVAVAVVVFALGMAVVCLAFYAMLLVTKRIILFILSL